MKQMSERHEGTHENTQSLPQFLYLQLTVTDLKEFKLHAVYSRNLEQTKPLVITCLQGGRVQV